MKDQLEILSQTISTGMYVVTYIWLQPSGQKMVNCHFKMVDIKDSNRTTFKPKGTFYVPFQLKWLKVLFANGI